MNVVNQIRIRSLLMVAVAGFGGFYELFKINSPRWPLIAGYAVVIGLALYRLASGRTQATQDKPSDESSES